MFNYSVRLLYIYCTFIAHLLHISCLFVLSCVAGMANMVIAQYSAELNSPQLNANNGIKSTPDVTIANLHDHFHRICTSIRFGELMSDAYAKMAQRVWIPMQGIVY